MQIQGNRKMLTTTDVATANAFFMHYNKGRTLPVNFSYLRASDLGISTDDFDNLTLHLIQIGVNLRTVIKHATILSNMELNAKLSQTQHLILLGQWLQAMTLVQLAHKVIVKHENSLEMAMCVANDRASSQNITEVEVSNWEWISWLN